MAARLGDVLYWLACGLAAVSIGTGTLEVYTLPATADRYTIFLFFGTIAVVIWIAGRAVKYVLSGH